MSFELKDMSGSLWQNERKQSETHPDRTGTVKIGGREYFINGWLKETSQGKKYLSLSFKPKEQRQRPDQPTPQSRDAHDEGFDDDIPF